MSPARQWRIAMMIAVGGTIVGGVSTLAAFDGYQRYHDKPTSVVASEVCEHQGPVTRVRLHDNLYYVTCHSGTVVLVTP